MVHAAQLFNTIVNTELLIGASIIVLFVLLAKKRYRDMLIFMLPLLGTWLSVEVLKRSFEIPRPLSGLVLTDSYRFPSGHAAFSALFFILIDYLFIRYIAQQRVRIALSIVSVSFVLLIGISRIYLQVHYPIDVVVGYLIGIFWSAVVIAWNTTKQ